MEHPEFFQAAPLGWDHQEIYKQDRHQLLLLIFIGWSIQQSVLLLICIYTTGLYFSHFIGKPVKTSNKKKKSGKQGGRFGVAPRALFTFWRAPFLSPPHSPGLFPRYFKGGFILYLGLFSPQSSHWEHRRGPSAVECAGSSAALIDAMPKIEMFACFTHCIPSFAE